MLYVEVSIVVKNVLVTVIVLVRESTGRVGLIRLGLIICGISILIFILTTILSYLLFSTLYLLIQTFHTFIHPTGCLIITKVKLNPMHVIAACPL